MFYAIVGSITFVAFILLIIVIYYNKFQFAIIKIDEAENNADIFLNKKYDLLKRCCPIIRKALKKKNILEEFDKLEIAEMNHFEQNDALDKAYIDLFQVIDENEKLTKSKPLTEVLKEINNNEEDLIASIKFYNDTVVDYNKLIMSFPSNIIRLIFRYKQKEFYLHEKHEIFEILKDENKENTE